MNSLTKEQQQLLAAADAVIVKLTEELKQMDEFIKNSRPSTSKERLQNKINVKKRNELAEELNKCNKEREELTEDFEKIGVKI
uniref:Uncharacterized protein n=1 Tax=Panagrolaimus davidi TaxID=227884 RepID=A0A914QFK1_9BILA